jgi:hypothetical protein
MIGQTIIFAIEIDEDRKYSDFIRVPIHSGDTVQKIVGDRGHPEAVIEVARLNGIADPRKILRHAEQKSNRYYAPWATRKRDWARSHDNRLRLPGSLRASERFEVLASLNGEAPTITGGYAKLEVVDRPGRTGISHFTGYDPSTMELPITFDGYRGSPGSAQGDDIEDACWLLERMGGRGSFPGSSTGPPAVIRISTLNSAGKPIPLIPSNYQWSDENKHAPVWRISGIDWDRNPIRNTHGNRVRQHANVTVQAYTRTGTVARSVVHRSKAKAKAKKGKGKKK